MNKNNIKPNHYNVGKQDLYESWFNTYPFNEFVAGMKMIAHRYLYRNKIDPIEDIDKAIETLERLKEYHIREREGK